jgi:hypothetical protein
LSKKPSKPPLPKLHDDDEEDRHDSGNATIVGKVDPALLRAAGRTRPAIPRPDPKSSSANKPTAKGVLPNKASDPFARPTAPPPPAAPEPAAPEPVVPATALASEPPFLDFELEEDPPKAPAKAPPLPPEAKKPAKKASTRPKPPEPEPTKKELPISRDSGEHTVAVRGFVLPRDAVPGAPQLGSDFDIPAQKAPVIAAPVPVPPPTDAGPSKFPSDITVMAVGGVAATPSSALPPSSNASSNASRAPQAAAKPGAELGKSTKPTLLVDRATLLAARAVDKRASIVLAYVDGNTDIDSIAENTGFLPSETLEIVRSLVAKGILSAK